MFRTVLQRSQEPSRDVILTTCSSPSSPSKVQWEEIEECECEDEEEDEEEQCGREECGVVL